MFLQNMTPEDAEKVVRKELGLPETEIKRFVALAQGKFPGDVIVDPSLMGDKIFKAFRSSQRRYPKGTSKGGQWMAVAGGKARYAMEQAKIIVNLRKTNFKKVQISESGPLRWWEQFMVRAAVGNIVVSGLAHAAKYSIEASGLSRKINTYRKAQGVNIAFGIIGGIAGYTAAQIAIGKIANLTGRRRKAAILACTGVVVGDAAISTARSGARLIKAIQARRTTGKWPA